jgi:putative addiction module killer protein
MSTPESRCPLPQRRPLAAGTRALFVPSERALYQERGGGDRAAARRNGGGDPARVPSSRPVGRAGESVWHRAGDAARRICAQNQRCGPSEIDRPDVPVLARVDRLAFGAFGDWKAVGERVCELRIHFSAGHRVYFGRDGKAVVILLCGGEKRTQDADIK